MKLNLFPVKLLLLAFIILAGEFNVIAQTAIEMPTLKFSIASDTSYVHFGGFPNRLSVARQGTGRNVTFQMGRSDFKTFISTTAFLQASRETVLQDILLHKSLVVIKDSTISVLKLKFEAEAQRAENFRAGYEDLKKVSENYHIELKSCIDDLQKLNNEKRKAKSWSFLKGALWGVAIGSVGGIIAGAAIH
jgi:hypothetical protein